MPRERLAARRNLERVTGRRGIGSRLLSFRLFYNFSKFMVGYTDLAPFRPEVIERRGGGGGAARRALPAPPAGPEGMGGVPPPPRHWGGGAWPLPPLPAPAQGGARQQSAP